MRENRPLRSTRGFCVTTELYSIWIFQVAGALTVGNGAKVILTGGALPQNIFWSVASKVSLGTGVQFSGNILSQTAITISTGASLNGRALAQTEVTLQGNKIVTPTSFTGPASLYNVIFTESGLTSGTSWNVTLGGVAKTSTSGTITFSEVNGSYSFSVAAKSADRVLPSKGNIVVNGTPYYQTITFTGQNKSVYGVTFTETGLATGTVWDVTLNGTTSSSNNGTITFFEVNGTYNYKVNPVVNYAIKQTSGTAVVSGKNNVTSVQFKFIAYAIVFKETGLPSGMVWYINSTDMKNSNQISLSSYTMYLMNGSYSYSAHSSKNAYSASGGTFRVSGHNVTVTVNFTPTQKKIGSPSNYDLYIIAAIIVVLAIIGSAAVWIFRKR
ncbi:MAG: ice-binding family protein [Cuniculiplasma sp.]